MSATRNGFKRLDTIEELSNYIDKLKITRKINGIQVHHMALPDYDCFYKANGKHEDELVRTINLNSYGVSMGWGGIAQNFNIFPNGVVTTGRDINKTPVGITGWNTGKICIEIYGDFDSGKDIMTKEQRATVIAMYGLLCLKLKLTPSYDTIRPHAWFTSGGTCLGDYNKYRSRKSCPGTAFMGIGNTKKAFTTYFYPWVKEYMETKKITYSNKVDKPKVTISVVKQTGKVASLDGDTLNVRKSYTPTSEIIGVLKEGAKVTITGDCSNGWLRITLGDKVGYVNGKYIEGRTNTITELPGKYIVRYLQDCLNTDYKAGLLVDGVFSDKTKSVVNAHYLHEGYRGTHVEWLQRALTNRGFKVSIDGVFGEKTLEALKQYQASRKLEVDGYAGIATHQAIIDD